MTYVVSHQDWTIAYGYLFRHPERSRPTGGVAEGPLHVAKATEQVPRLRLAEPVPSEVEGLGSGRDDGSFWSYAIAPAKGRGAIIFIHVDSRPERTQAVPANPTAAATAGCRKR